MLGDSSPLAGILHEGLQTIENVTLLDQSFSHIYLGARADVQAVLVKNVSLARCRVSPGEFGVFSNVKLVDVRLDSLLLGKGLRISSEAWFENVQLTGRWVGQILINPSKALRHANTPAWGQNASEVALDLRGLECNDLTIVGVPLSLIRYDPSRFVAINLSSAVEANGERLSDMARYVARMHAQEGLFSRKADGAGAKKEV